MSEVTVLGTFKAASLGAMVFAASIALGQSATVQPAIAGSAYKPHMSFDVASIREYRSHGGMRYVDDMPHNSYYHAEGVGLFGLLRGAYELKLREHLENLPKWADQTLYTIDAKSGSDTDAALEKLSASDALAEKRHMMQLLLAERFHLQIHSETRISNTYELITTDRTAKLMTPVQGDIGKTVNTCVPHFAKLKGAEVDSKGCPFHIFFDELMQNLGTDVLDHTGMTGMYAFHLRWWPAQLPEDGPSEDRYPPLRNAMRDQLGLELKPTKGPMTFWVIDHIERPTVN